MSRLRCVCLGLLRSIRSWPIFLVELIIVLALLWYLQKYFTLSISIVDESVIHWTLLKPFSCSSARTLSLFKTLRLNQYQILISSRCPCFRVLYNLNQESINAKQSPSPFDDMPRCLYQPFEVVFSPLPFISTEEVLSQWAYVRPRGA